MRTLFAFISWLFFANFAFADIKSPLDMMYERKYCAKLKITLRVVDETGAPVAGANAPWYSR